MRANGRLVRLMSVDAGSTMIIVLNTRWISDARWRWKCWRRGWDRTGAPK